MISRGDGRKTKNIIAEEKRKKMQRKTKTLILK